MMRASSRTQQYSLDLFLEAMQLFGFLVICNSIYHFLHFKKKTLMKKEKLFHCVYNQPLHMLYISEA